MTSSVLRRLCMVTACLITSCGDNTSPLFPPSVVGLYVLESVTGDYGPSEGTIVLAPDGRAQRSITYAAQNGSAGQTVVQSGTFSLPTDTTIAFLLNDSCPQSCRIPFFGSRADGTLSIAY